MARQRQPVMSGSLAYVAGAQMDVPGKKGRKPVKGLTVAQITGKAPRTPSESAAGTTIQKPVTTPPPPTTTTVAFKPDAGWWTRQFGADPRWLQNAPVLRGQEEGLASSYGYRINRNAAGQPLFKSKATGASGIYQLVDDKGSPILDEKGGFQYRDAAGNPYSVGDLEMDVQRIQKGQTGYLEGALGAAEAGSERRQYGIGDTSAQAGARRSGMRAQAASAESDALQSALASLGTRYGSDSRTIAKQYLDLYDSIFGDLVKEAASTPGTEVTTGTPASTPAPAAANTNPLTETGLVAGQALSGGPSGQFMGQANAIVGQRDAPYKSKKASLLALKRFSLTPQQIRWIDTWIKNNAP